MSSLDEIKALLAGKSPGQKQGGSDIAWYRTPSGTEQVKVRVLPPWEGSNFPFRIIKKHYGLPDMGDKKSFTCMTTFNMECPVCETLAKYEGLDAANDFSAKVEAYANIYVRKDPTQRVDVNKIYVAKFTKPFVEWYISLLESEGDITDFNAGRDVLMEREKTNGKFKLTPGFQATAASQDEETTRGQLYNLDKFWAKASDDDMNFARKIAAAVDERLDTIVVNGGPDNAGVPDRAEGEQEPTQEVKKPAAAKSTATTKTSAPASKPAAAATTTKPAAASPRPNPSSRPAAATAKADAKPAAKAAAPGVPAGAPECFANPEVHNAEREECIQCPSEFQCTNSINARAAG